MSEPADGSGDLVRLWFEGDELNCNLDAGAFSQPDTWGVVLADLARHVANALQQQAGADETDVMSRIRAAFDADLDGASETSG